MKKSLATVASVLALAAAGAAPAHAQGGSGTGGGAPSITTAVSAAEVCDGTSSLTVTLRSAGRHTNEMELFTTNVRAGYWMTTVTRDGDGGLVMGVGTGYPEISGGLFLRQATTLGGSLPRGTSGVTVVSQRTATVPDVGVPVLETCTAHLTVTTR